MLRTEDTSHCQDCDQEITRVGKFWVTVRTTDVTCPSAPDGRHRPS